MKAIIETRSMSMGSSRYRRPDMYVAVQLVPEGVEPLKVLREDSAKKRGIEIIRCGDFYSGRTGAGSRYVKAMAEAERTAAKYNH
jgi:hypothetical protein